MDAAQTAFAPAISGGSAELAAPAPQLDSGRVRDIVLVRLATAGKAIVRKDLAQELWPIVAHLQALPDWQTTLDRDLGALADAGLCDAKPVAISITAAGDKRAALVLGVDKLPRTWFEARSSRLIAKALDMGTLPARRLKPLLKAEGLRAAIVQHAFKLKIRGLPTPARLRAQLAKLALSHAFGNTLPEGLNGRSGLSAKAGRALAGRLAMPPKDYPTDSRLIGALAMQQAGAHKADFESLQTALLRRYVTRGKLDVAPARAKPRGQSARPHQSRPISMSAAPATATQITAAPSSAPQRPAAATVASASIAAMPIARPDFNGFVTAVRGAANAVAEGWPGNRKAFVSRVWQAVQQRHANWGINEIEFKGMLAEAHRAGRINLANADLKDHRSIADVQASAIAYRNSIFHYVRVDD